MLMLTVLLATLISFPHSSPSEFLRQSLRYERNELKNYYLKSQGGKRSAAVWQCFHVTLETPNLRPPLFSPAKFCATHLHLHLFSPLSILAEGLWHSSRQWVGLGHK